MFGTWPRATALLTVSSSKPDFSAVTLLNAYTETSAGGFWMVVSPFSVSFQPSAMRAFPRSTFGKKPSLLHSKFFHLVDDSHNLIAQAL